MLDGKHEALSLSSEDKHSLGFVFRRKDESGLVTWLHSQRKRSTAHQTDETVGCQTCVGSTARLQQSVGTLDALCSKFAQLAVPNLAEGEAPSQNMLDCPIQDLMYVCSIHTPSHCACVKAE